MNLAEILELVVKKYITKILFKSQMILILKIHKW